MDISYALLRLPPLILLLSIILFCSLLGGGATYLFRKYLQVRVLRSHNEVLGIIFAAVGGFYALLLGFVVFLVWSSFSDAQSNANKEGSMAKALYRNIKFYPDSVKTSRLMTAYMGYVHGVVEEEYPGMEAMQPVTKDQGDRFNSVYKNIEHIYSSDTRIDQMFRNLNELAIFRSLRRLDASDASDIPLEIWIPLIIGGLIVLFFAILLDIENNKLHVLINMLLGAFVGLVFYIIITLDHPFSGKLKIQPEDYDQIIEMNKNGQ